MSSLPISTISGSESTLLIERLANLDTSTDDFIQSLENMRTITDFIPSQLSHLASLISRKIETDRNIQVLPLIARIISLYPYQGITPFHHIIPKLALLTHTNHQITPILQCKLTIMAHPYRPSIQDYLLFTYYSALYLMRNADYVSAIKHIKACLGSPTQHPSQIHIEAYKVFSILRILQRNAIHLSEYTADCVIRVTRKECLVYVQLVEAFNQSISSYTQFLDKNRVILKKDNHLNLLKGKGLEACWLNSLLNQGKCVSRANLEFVCREMTGNHRVNDLNDLELLIKKSDGVEIDEETKIVVFEGKYVCKNLEISVEETELIRSEMFARLNEVNML